MGIHSSDVYEKKKKTISIISLNYSGILLSPFQFFSKENQQLAKVQTDLSNIYKHLLKKYYPTFSENKKQNKFKWNLGKIDQKMQKQRYSPLYNPKSGIQQQRLLNEEQFKAKWNLVFNNNIEAFKTKQPGFKYTEQQKKQAVQFDLLCYKSILVHVYHQQLKNFQFEKIQKLKPMEYVKFMTIMFSKSFLNEKKKLEKTFQAMKRQKIDIVFAQEADQVLINELKKKKQYHVFSQQNSNSIIVLKRQKFHRYYSLKDKSPLDQVPDLKKQLKWNEDTVVAFVDNLILISGHLSSKKQKNPSQVFQMMQSLRRLNALYPMCHIIVGCDVNSYMHTTFADYCKQNAIYCTCQKNIKEGKPKFEYKELNNLAITKKSSENNNNSEATQLENIELEKHKYIQDCWCFRPQNCQIYPDDSSLFTTLKQRTYLQPQINKAEQVAKVCRDHLIFIKGNDISIQKKDVCTISSKSIKQSLINLPCQQHPYDHFVVKAQLTINVMTHFENNQEE